MKKGALFRTLRVLIVLSISISIAAVLLKMRPRAERREVIDTGRLVEVFPAAAKRLHMVIETYGTVRPREDLKLAAEVRGRIVDMHRSFEAGFFVEKGTRLMQIDPRTFRLEVERQQVQMKQIDAEMMRLKQEIRNLAASIKISKSNVVLEKAEFVRLKELAKRKVTAQTNLDKAEQRYLASLERLQGLENQMALTGPMMAQLDARKQMAEVAHRQARLNLDRTGIVAPFSGWVLDKAVETGQFVNVGQYLGRIYRHGVYDIEVRIPTEDLKWLPETLSGKDGPVARIVFRSGHTEKIWQGRVARAKAGMDEKTRTLPLIVEVDDPDAGTVKQKTFQLKPGMFVTVRIQGREIDGIFVLPRHVVHAGDVVYLAVKDRLKVRSVRVLRRFKNSVYVDQGLDEGELVIKTPLTAAVDEMAIRVKP